MGDLPAIEGDSDYTNHFSKLLYATRVGNARFPGLKKDQSKTYKAWAESTLVVGWQSLVTLDGLLVLRAMLWVTPMKLSKQRML